VPWRFSDAGRRSAWLASWVPGRVDEDVAILICCRLGIPQRGGVCGQEPIFAAGSVPFATDDDIRTSSHNGPRPRTETP
jgi:hypothetical protein